MVQPWRCIKQWWGLVLLVGWLLGGAVTVAQAQSALALSSLDIQIWPEFDRPQALVILDGVLTPETPLPAEVTLHLPLASGGPSAVAEWATANRLVDAVYTTTQSGSDIILVLTVKTRQFRVEYYDPSLSIVGTDRTYNFNWTTPYAVGAVTMRVQKPFDASNLQTTPALPNSQTADYSLTYLTGSVGAALPGQALQLQVTYSKPTPQLSLAAVEAANPATTPTNNGSATTTSNNNMWLLGLAALGVALAGGGGWWYWHTRRQAASVSRKTARARPRPHQPTAPKAARPALPTSKAFCTQCGQPTQAGDTFCRHCGAKLRSNT